MLSTVINCIKGRLIKANLLQWLSGYIGVSALPDALRFSEHVLAVVRLKYSSSSPPLCRHHLEELSQLRTIMPHLLCSSFILLLLAAGGAEQEPGETFLQSFSTTVVPKVCTVVPGDSFSLGAGECLGDFSVHILHLSCRCHRQYGG